MDNNDSNMKPQQTGGLKLMTVFIAVLALHVVVIGGFTVYHLMSGGTTDADLATSDKNHKSLKNADSSASTDAATTDSTSTDKAASTTAPEVGATTTTPPPATAPDTTTPTPAPAAAATSSPSPAPAVTPTPTPAATTPKPTPTVPSTDVASAFTPSGPIAPELAPPAEPILTPAPVAAPVAPATPTTPALAGPVHMPPATAVKPAREHEHEMTYTVKITDSYKKIAKAHHVTVAQLKEANHIKGDVLHTGQKLIIPGKTSVAGTASANSLEAAPTTPVLGESVAPMTTSLVSGPASSHSHLYTIVKGDTLTKIAHKFKTTASAIISENSITDPTKLTIGKKLRIPSGESRSARNYVPPATEPSQVQSKQNGGKGQLANFVP
jgi:LysM repeat protein